MYEHLRNTFVTQLLTKYNIDDVNYISNILDKIISDYDITEKCTELAVVDDEFSRIANIYLASKKLEGCSDATISNYRDILRIFYDIVQNRPQDITTNEIRMFFVQYQTLRGVSDRTLDKYRQVINTFFEWLVNEEYITKNPCKNIREFKYEVVPRQALTRRQLEELRRKCTTKRDLAIVDVLYSTACRVSELINMKFSDLNLQDYSVHIIGKGSKHNTVYLNTNAQISLEEYITKERKGDSEYIFVSTRAPYEKLSTRTIEHIFSKKELQVATKQLSPHIIRHTTATLAVQSGMPITQVQKMLGHSSVATTQIYAETSQEEVAISHKRFVV